MTKESMCVVIPATPGYALLELPGRDTSTLLRVPIVAWMVDVTRTPRSHTAPERIWGTAEPVTPGFFRENDGDAIVATPDGRLLGSSTVFATEADVVAELKRRRGDGPFEPTRQLLLLAQEAVRVGGPWRADPLADEWVGWQITRAWGLHPSPDSRLAAKSALAVWIRTGMFVEVKRRDEKGRLRTFVEVGEEPAPSPDLHVVEA